MALTPELKAQALVLFGEGKSAGEVATALGLSYQQAYRIAWKHKRTKDNEGQ